MLLGELELNAGPAVSSLAKVDAKFSSTVATATKLGSGLATAFASIASIGALLAGFSSALDLGGKLQDLHNQTGETVGDLVIIRQALENAGLGADSAGDFLLKFQDSIAGVNEDGKATAAALTLLGTSAGELRDLPAIGQLEKLSAGFQKLDQTSRVAAARDIFGKSGGKALSLFADEGGLAQARQQAAPLAAVAEKTVASFDKLGDTLNGLKLNVQEFFFGALSKIAPEATTIAEQLERIDFVAIGEGFGELAKTVGSFAVAIAEAAKWFSDFIDTAAEFALGSKAPELSAFNSRGVTRRRREDESSGRDLQFSSLHRAGGGGFNFSAGDPLLSENQRQTRLLGAIHTALTTGPLRTGTLDRTVPV
jgi:hypothetical protein